MRGTYPAPGEEHPDRFDPVPRPETLDLVRLKMRIEREKKHANYGHVAFAERTPTVLICQRRYRSPREAPTPTGN